jgi:hypothetical protein
VLEFFKKNHLFNSLLLLPYALILRMVVLVFPSQGSLARFMATGLKEIIASIQHWGVGSYLLSTFLVFIPAAIVNRLYIKQSMIGEINLFPGLCYILLTRPASFLYWAELHFSGQHGPDVWLGIPV